MQSAPAAGWQPVQRRGLGVMAASPATRAPPAFDVVRQGRAAERTLASARRTDLDSESQSEAELEESEI